MSLLSSSGDIVGNDTTDEFASKLAAAVTPAFGSGFANSLLKLYDLPPARSGRGAEHTTTMQLKYANVLSDGEELCNNLALASVWAPYFASAKTPLYTYGVTQRPGNPFCALKSFELHPYCPTFSFHGIDMFALFGWLPPSRGGVTYNVTAEDMAFTALVRARFIEFATNGTIASWPEFRRTPMAMPSGRTGPPRSIQSGYDVVNLAIGGDVADTDLRVEQCNLFLSRGFYDNKSWVN